MISEWVDRALLWSFFVLLVLSIFILSELIDTTLLQSLFSFSFSFLGRWWFLSSPYQSWLIWLCFNIFPFLVIHIIASWFDLQIFHLRIRPINVTLLVATINFDHAHGITRQRFPLTSMSSSRCFHLCLKKNLRVAHFIMISCIA